MTDQINVVASYVPNFHHRTDYMYVGTQGSHQAEVLLDRYEQGQGPPRPWGMIFNTDPIENSGALDRAVRPKRRRRPHRNHGLVRVRTYTPNKGPIYVAYSLTSPYQTCLKCSETIRMCVDTTVWRIYMPGPRTLVLSGLSSPSCL